MPSVRSVRGVGARGGRPPLDRRQSIGALGERIAARWLERSGWRVLARRFRSGHRDLDLVVRRGSVVAFVEVKARCGVGAEDPVEAVRWRKQRELVRSARAWIDRHGREGETYRFDVLGVLLEPPPRGSGAPSAGGRRARPLVRVRHVADAFQVPPDA